MFPILLIYDPEKAGFHIRTKRGDMSNSSVTEIPGGSRLEDEEEVVMMHTGKNATEESPFTRYTTQEGGAEVLAQESPQCVEKTAHLNNKDADCSVLFSLIWMIPQGCQNSRGTAIIVQTAIFFFFFYKELSLQSLASRGHLQAEGR